MESNPNATLRDQLVSLEGCEKVDMCFSCGTCVSRCLIQQKIEPEYNPRRLLKMIALDMEKEAYSAPTVFLCSACDLCYEACPQQIHISAILTNTKKLAFKAGYTSPLKVAKVDEQTCVACGYCEKVCPYQAITLQEKKIPFRGNAVLVATVDAEMCMACGTCSVACRSNSIELQELENSEMIMDSLWTWIERGGVNENSRI
ncbi:MAG: 4Fe-4S binding protein [Chloroflexi bacterium]|nr:4Fe-4S binding protein [Chloroflexota bacterium]